MCQITFHLEPSQWIALTHRDIPKTEKICMSGPVEFDEKLKIVKPVGNHPFYFLEWSKTFSTCYDVGRVDLELS